MGILVTKALQEKLEKLGAGATQVFCEEFAVWKKDGPHVLFGKDGPYRKPQLAGDDKLMHVHLIPSVSKGDNDLWMKRWNTKRPPSHRTSDHVLVYVENMAGDYLLIAILDEPGAHAIQDMRTAQNKATIEGFATVAQVFCQDGSVIA